jgi:hypothetical protein
MRRARRELSADARQEPVLSPVLNVRRARKTMSASRSDSRSKCSWQRCRECSAGSNSSGDTPTISR